MFCLTIDIDWAQDAVIADTLGLIESHGQKATWFVTHSTKMLDEIRAAGGHELGLHPNFNPLLDGQTGTAEDVLRRLHDVSGGATAVRSHSLVRSSRLAAIYRKLGLTHESNYFMPPALGSLHIWRDYSDLIQVPIRWEDDVRLLDETIGEPASHLSTLDPFVVDFHPIHIFLNTVTMKDYETARGSDTSPDGLKAHRRPPSSNGSRDRFVALLDAAKALGLRSSLISTIQPNTGG